MSRLPILRRSAIATCIAASTVLVATGCGGSAGAGSSDANGTGTNRKAVTGVSSDVNAAQCGKSTRTIKDDLGTTVIKGDPKRVVALEFSFVDSLANVGLKPVGVADDGKPARVLPQLRAQIGSYASVGLRASPNLQVIKSLKPDLILADDARDKALLPQLSKIAPTVTTASLLADYQQIKAGETLIGAAVNQCDRMKAALAANATVMSGLKAKVPAGDKRKVLFAIASEKAVTGDTALSFAPSVLQQLGLRQALSASKGDASVGMTLETLVSTSPDVLFIANSTPKTLVDQWKTNPLWKSIPAVKNNAVYTVDGDVWSKSRGLLAAQLVAQQAVNDLFGTS